MNNIFKFFLINVALVFSLKAGAQSFKTVSLDSGKNTSIRGMSVLNNKVAWLSGSNGWVAKTIDGNTFIWMQVKGYEKIDFRDIEAFSAKVVIIVSAGSPAYILKTTDGGENWKKVYENTSPVIFLDGMEFLNKKEGFIFGDPIDGFMQLLATKNGGETWENISEKAAIMLQKGEAAFAASGTSIRSFKNKIYIATGGKVTNLYTSQNKGISWVKEQLPLIQGKASTGCFSLAISKQNVFAIGGDYLQDKQSDGNFAFRLNNEDDWRKSKSAPSGYKSCVAYFGDNKLLATGTSGTDISFDSGLNWLKIDNQSFDVCQKAEKGKLVLLAGSKGKVSKLVKLD
ncbi:WD40/YVTN/BNR-like repeat-containing protein [Pedobacter alpinus]|uniref:WD40/YVTN/BNR-like repeat-containing protein n=1 Tax=Pedobacter alpinus TaxID=1590643 RepID=A0ABW5TWC1_9SPHI